MVTDGSIVTKCKVCGTKNRIPRSAAGSPRCAKCKSALPWIVDAGDETFNEVVTDSHLPVLVDIWAPWCGPCRAVSPALERLAEEFAGRIKLVKINADSAPGVSARFEARAIPTLLLMSGDRIL